jgi:peroxiredoxin
MKTLAFIAATVLLMSFALSPGYKVGDKVADFKLKNIDGKMVSLADFKEAKGFIITFTCNHCPFAKAYEDRIIALNKLYAPKGYPVIAINPNDPKQVEEDSFVKMQERARSKNFTFPYLMDETQDIAHAYGAAHTPHVFILQKSGNDYIVKYIGAIDDNSDDAAAVKEKYVESAVNELLAGKPVSQPTTKAIGCSIKWKS